MNSMEKFNLKNRVIVITGAAGLIGRQYVKSLSDCGAISIVADCDRTAAEKVVEEYGMGLAAAFKMEVSDRSSVVSTIKQVMKEFGRIDGLVNNAALDPKFDPEHDSQHTLTFENYPLEMWKKELSVNIDGMFLCAQAVAPYMLKQGKGNIVNISSIYGMAGPDQRLYQSDSGEQSFKPATYTVSKSAVFGLTKYLAAYWRGKGIRVNTLTLGGVFNHHDDIFVQKYSDRTLLARMADADEYCGALIFLLSDAASYMTGANLVVDGGWTAW